MRIIDQFLGTHHHAEHFADGVAVRQWTVAMKAVRLIDRVSCAPWTCLYVLHGPGGYRPIVALRNMERWCGAW
jgi:hypothetical protein